MRVWTLSVNGEVQGVFDSEEKVVEARRRHLASGLECGRLTVLSVGHWVVQRMPFPVSPNGHSEQRPSEAAPDKHLRRAAPAHAPSDHERISMPSMFHQPSTAVTGPLEPGGQREGADSGDPQISWTAFGSSDDVKVGVWEAARRAGRS